MRRELSKKTLVSILLLALLCPWGCTEHRAGGHPLAVDPIVVSPESYSELQKLFDSIGYNLIELEEAGVPRLVLTRLPRDLEDLNVIPERKRIFFQSLLPMVLLANEEIAFQRSRLTSIMKRHRRGWVLSKVDSEWLLNLVREYDLSGNPLENSDLMNRLLRRVDTIPPSLVLAQAANESGWGTSRFAMKANNLFGEWTFTPGTGIVPKDRPEGAKYEVRKFDTIYRSVVSYMNNLNTHRAYRPLRSIRAEIREKGRQPDGLSLAEGLEKYSTRRIAYVRDIQQMIRQNDLTELSQVSLKNM